MSSITLRDVALFFPHKVCFEHFSTVLMPGSCVGIMGANGCGKSSLLRMLHGSFAFPHCTEGEIVRLPPRCMAYMPQNIGPVHGGEQAQSGGESLFAAITEAFAQETSVLLLDEPSNHLDQRHRAGLLRLIKAHAGTLVIVSHDDALLQNMDVLWHIHDGMVSVFTGNLGDYLREHAQRQSQCEDAAELLRQRQKIVRKALQQQQNKKGSDKARGEKKFGNDKMQLGNARSWGEQHAGKRVQRLREEEEQLDSSLRTLGAPQSVQPRFQLPGRQGSEHQNAVTIADGTLSYGTRPILRDIHFFAGSRERIALYGDNGSGKSTLLQGCMQAPGLKRQGMWHTPPRAQVGYLDQHYALLHGEGKDHKTVLDVMGEALPGADHATLRRHLNDFLFRKNAEVTCPLGLLSGGEQARLCLALLAAHAPRLLLLDEMTNNLDRETRAYVVEVLRDFPGVLILVSHDKAFLEGVGLTGAYHVRNGTVSSL